MELAPSSDRRTIGLTGGIGMGKTVVSNYLATSHHLPVLDADILAREAVEPGSPVLAEILDRYGPGILQPDGTLHRQRLGDIIFNSPAERVWLEQQIHPYVRERLVTLLNAEPLCDRSRYPIVVLVIPLLFEARMTDLVTEIWVVQSSEAQQLVRLMGRDHLTIDQAQARIQSQLSLQRKIAEADVVLDNSGTLERLFEQVNVALIPPIP